ncbi:MAG: peptidylprolyl isomerase, partial [Patescibacteria group bacterium]
MKQQTKIRWQFAGVLLLGLISGLISYPNAVSFIPPVYNVLQNFQINKGLDLQGGIHLEYLADVSNVPSDKVDEALSAAEAVIERRVNAFGVGEPLVQLSKSGGEDRIIVELPGIKDIEQAKKMIKETPFLEFRELAGADVTKQFDDYNATAKTKIENILQRAKAGEDFAELAKQSSEDPGSKDKGGDLDFVKQGTFVPEFDDVVFNDTLKPGEVYGGLVESTYGWHVIKKLEERGEGD